MLNSNSHLGSTAQVGFIYGSCLGDCAVLFKISEGQLFADNEEVAYLENYNFNDTPLLQDKYDKAKILLEHLPEDLIGSAETTFGMPDVYDQGAIILKTVFKGGDMELSWNIDTDEDNLPDFLIPYVQEIKLVMDELQE